MTSIFANYQRVRPTGVLMQKQAPVASPVRFKSSNAQGGPAPEEGPRQETPTRGEKLLNYLLAVLLGAVPSGIGFYELGKRQPDNVGLYTHNGPLDFRKNDNVILSQVELTIPGAPDKTIKVSASWELVDQARLEKSIGRPFQGHPDYSGVLYDLSNKLIKRQLLGVLYDHFGGYGVNDLGKEKFEARVKRMLLEGYDKTDDRPWRSNDQLFANVVSLPKAFENHGLKMHLDNFTVEVAERD